MSETETHIRLRGVLIPKEQVATWEDIHGGKVVRDEQLATILQKLVWRYKKSHNVYPDAMRPPEYPGEEFVPIQISVTVPLLGINVPSQYHVFIRRKVLHILGGVARV